MRIHKENSQRLYENNYQKMSVLFSDTKHFEHITLSGDNTLMDVEIDVIERTKYTILLELSLNYKNLYQCTPPPSLQVRMFHDAEVAEVLSIQGQRRIRARNIYPNPRMHLPDEKRQINTLLSEMLSFFLINHYQKSYIRRQIEINE